MPSPSLFQPAVKEKLKARIAIDGPTGSGKTFTAHQVARILVGEDGPIGTIDTEHRSAAYYAPSRTQLIGVEPINRLNYWDAPYVFGHMPWSPPYDPIKLTDMIGHAASELGENGCLIIDSFSHFWEGEGGTLDVVDNAAARSNGNKFAGWKEGTPAQRALLDAIIHAPCHVICCMRSKMEYILEQQTRNGQTTTSPRKIGMRPIQREGVEYEFTVIADMDLEHRLTITKSRCSLVSDVVATKGHSHEWALVFRDWLDSGVERITTEQADALVAAMNSVEVLADRKALKEAFVGQWGKPTEITTDRAAEVVAWVSERVHRLNGTTPPAAEGMPEPGDTPPATDTPPPPDTPPPDDTPAMTPEPTTPASEPPAADTTPEPADPPADPAKSRRGSRSNVRHETSSPQGEPDDVPPPTDRDYGDTVDRLL